MQNRISTADQKRAKSADLKVYERTRPSQHNTSATTAAADCTPSLRGTTRETQLCRVLVRPPNCQRKQLGKKSTVISGNGYQKPKKSHKKTATARNVTQVTSVTESGELLGQLIYGPCRHPSNARPSVCTAIRHLFNNFHRSFPGIRKRASTNHAK